MPRGTERRRTHRRRGAIRDHPARAPHLVPRSYSTATGGAIPLARHQASGPPVVVMGTGRFVAPGAGVAAATQAAISPGGDVTLNFVKVDVRDVARSVLGDLLQLSFVVDPSVQGTVTLQTGRPIPRSAVLPTLQNALALDGIALVGRDGIWRLVPIANAAREAGLGGDGGSGFITRIVSPRFVAAADLARVLQPLLPPGASVRADASRDALIVSGTDQSVSDILDDIAIFDVDALRGVSFALLPLANAQAGDVAREVASLIGAAGGGIAGLVHITPIDRLNAVLVTSMRPAYLTQVRGWVASLDRSGGNGEPQLYVYRVQNGRAADLATVLRQALGIAGSGAPAAPAMPAPPGATAPPVAPSVAPGLSDASSRVPTILTGGLPNDIATPRSPFNSAAGAGKAPSG